MKILVIKIGALGDVVRTSFVAQALKEKYKDKDPHLFWLTHKNAQDIFANNPYVDRLILDEEKMKDRVTRSYWNREEFDLIVNFAEDLETVKFASFLNAKERIGFFLKDGKIVPTPTAKEWFDMSLHGEKPQNDILKKQNKKTHRQMMAQIIGVDYKKYEPIINLRESQKRLSKDFLRRYNLDMTKDLIIGINTGSAGRWRKQLPVNKTVTLIDRLVKRFNAKIILFGGPNEIERNKEIVKKTKSYIVDTGCYNTLSEFMAFVNCCNMFISSDSLGFHIALALKRKTICLIGPTSHTEIDNEFGENVIADSKCICCYKKDCKSMEKISLDKILSSVNRLITKKKVTLLINAYKEPAVSKALEAALNQKTRHHYEVILSAPDKETLSIADKYKNKNLTVFKDPGKGKSYAINLLLPKISTDILILTDGDVFISDDAVENITNLFFYPEIGCVTGRPVPVETRETKYGYWANFLFNAAHDLRLKLHKHQSFIECSGYLFAFRKEKITRFPIDVAEDTIIPYFFWRKGYKIGYADAKVYVKNPNNWTDWIKQKIRTTKSHENIGNYVDVKMTPQVKTFKTELKGFIDLIRHPQSFKECLWAIELAFSRLYMWSRFYLDRLFKIKRYGDAWERIESTK